MGYSSEMFIDIAKLDLISNKVLDIGAQDVLISNQNELSNLNEFIRSKNLNNFFENQTFPVVIQAKDVYERAGFEYTNIDVDERPGTVRIDLAAFQIPKERNRYGLVVNVGTTEHLSSPIATYALMHELACVGGYLYNDVPLFGFGNHGLINPTPKFWHALNWMNQYKMLSIRVREFNEPTIDKGNFYHDYLHYMEGLENITNVSYLIRAIFRKDKNTNFVVPFDAVFPNSDNGLSLAKLLAGSYYPFYCTGSYTAVEIEKGINDFLKLNMKEYRVKNYLDLIDANILIKFTDHLKLKLKKNWIEKIIFRFKLAFLEQS